MGKKIAVSVRLIAFLAIVTLCAAYVTFADPNAPTSLTEGTNNRRNLSGPGLSQDAQAGNITQLTIQGISVTQSWQGFYGTITGEITLDNANNFTLYNWDLASPQGEVYAANDTAITWSDVRCVNLTGITAHGPNQSELNAMYGIGATDADRFEVTFNETYSGSFLIGSNTIDAADECPMALLYNGSDYHSADWEEVLLTDNNTRTVIFASILNQDSNGFNNATVDFQMLVAEDGHSGDTTVTPYYFYLELE